MEKQQSEDDVTEQMHKKKIDRCKEELCRVKLQLIQVQEKWEDKLTKLDAELSTANDLVVAQKSKCRQLIQRQRDEAKEHATQVQNNKDSFLQENSESEEESVG